MQLNNRKRLIKRNRQGRIGFQIRSETRQSQQHESETKGLTRDLQQADRRLAQGERNQQIHIKITA